jgi:hypothetical protein
MKIKDMFEKSIDRPINGVVQVEQEEADVVQQEIEEYVVTTELKKHFMKFFNEYSESFDVPTDNVGVWITGFFGSGKSHFLKMLSYLLENKEINHKKTVDYFEEKFDDEGSFMNIQKCTQVPTETILFNIDVEGSVHKDDTAIIRVFAKVFYNHLGFYGRDIKLAKLEQFITEQGKMEEFKKRFKEVRNKTWEEARGTYQFLKKDIIKILSELDIMSEDDARDWFKNKQEEDYSIEELVEEIKAYVDSKPKGFRLLFMIDEAGQYIGENGSMLLNLQSITEKLGSVCRGQVWIIATGQEALDEMAIKLREDEFSKIQARFPIRLSLTSSSVGEVIEKRLLAKKEEAKERLEDVYDTNENVLKNLYTFDTEVKDLKGYTSKDEFVRVFPFVPYQFIIMQKVFNEIRKHGHAGKNQSSGERSMLNGFQESAQQIEEKNELTLVPLYAFYDTLHSSLDTSVRSVIERAEKAAEQGNGLTVFDVNLLKLLYLVRYVDDIQSNIENLTILMADTITIDKLSLKEEIRNSLDRLQKMNYISRNGDVYQFLTNEEQDIARDINNQNVDSANVISEVGKIIFDDIYTTRKFRYTRNKSIYDFDFDKSVDNQNHGSTTGGMKLRFVTEVFDDANDLKLMSDSKGNEAICRLSNEYPIFTDIENSLKITKYITQKNVSQLAESAQAIITNKQKESRRLLKEAKENISNAIIHGQFYIDGQMMNFSGSSVKAVLDEVMQCLVEHTYSAITEIDTPATTDADIRGILNGIVSLEDMEGNKQAIDTVYRYLQSRAAAKMPVSMADIQSRYQNIPYGWKELDIASVVAQLLQAQKITIKYSGQTIQPKNPQMVDFLKKKSEIGQVKVSIRETIPARKIKQVKEILKDYFDCTDIPNDEDSLVEFIVNKFNKEKAHLEEMQKSDENIQHPGNGEILTALKYVEQVLLSQNDNIALINTICDLENDLLDSKDDMDKVKNFYQSQINLYDKAIQLKKRVLSIEKDYLMDIPRVKEAIDKITEITKISNHYQYNRIPELNDYIAIINDERDTLIQQKKIELNTLIDSCYHEVELKANTNEQLNGILRNAKKQFDIKKQEVQRLTDIAYLDAKTNQITNLKDNLLRQMELALSQEPKVKEESTSSTTNPKKIRPLQRAVVFDQATLSSPEDVDRYLKNIKNKLLSYLNDDEEIQIK